MSRVRPERGLFWISGRCPECAGMFSVQSSDPNATIAHIVATDQAGFPVAVHGWRPSLVATPDAVATPSKASKGA